MKCIHTRKENGRLDIFFQSGITRPSTEPASRGGMSLLSPSPRYLTLKIVPCFVNIVAACEFGLIAGALAELTTVSFDSDDSPGSDGANEGFIAAAVAVGLLALAGLVLAWRVWLESIDTTVSNLVYLLFATGVAALLIFLGGFQSVIFSAGGVPSLIGCCCCARYLSLLRRGKRAREQGDGAVSVTAHQEDDSVSTAYSCDATLSPSRGVRAASC